MRSINNTEQFIKAKQAEVAAQERHANQNGVSGRNYKKNINLTDIHALANSTNSSFMAQQYTGGKSPFEQPISIRDPNKRRPMPQGTGPPAVGLYQSGINLNQQIESKMGRNSKLKTKLGPFANNTN